MSYHVFVFKPEINSYQLQYVSHRNGPTDLYRNSGSDYVFDDEIVAYRDRSSLEQVDDPKPFHVGFKLSFFCLKSEIISKDAVLERLRELKRDFEIRGNRQDYYALHTVEVISLSIEAKKLSDKDEWDRSGLKSWVLNNFSYTVSR